MKSSKRDREKEIFIQIASYRDDELVKTLESCLKAADYPDRLRFGIFHQWDEATRSSLDKYKEDSRFRIQEVAWQESRGVGYARYKCNLLYEGEEFMMQVDSHMRFDDGWDSAITQEWNKCYDSQAVLTAYPSPFLYNDDGTEKRLPYGPNQLIIKKFVDGKTPIFKGMPVGRKIEGAPRRAMYVAGGFIFGAGDICRKVPYVQEVCFTGEEMVYSINLFRYGYTVYTPNELGIYHLYERPDSSRFWNDMPKAEERFVREKHKRMNTENDAYLEALFSDRGLEFAGAVRTLQEFENYSGVCFKKRLIHPDQTALREPPYAYSNEWTSREFELQRINISLKLDLMDEHKDKNDVVMWRVKLLAEHDIAVYSKDIPIEHLRANNFRVTIQEEVQQRPIRCRIRPYCGDDKWYDPVIMDIDTLR